MPEKEFDEISYPSSRQLTFDVGKIGLGKHHVRALLEVDVTEARRLIKQSRGRGKVGEERMTNGNGSNERMDRIERTLDQITEIQRRTDERLDRITERHEALAQTVEILGGILSGEGAIGPRSGPVHNGTFILLLEVARFLPLVEFGRQVDELVGWVKSAESLATKGTMLTLGVPAAPPPPTSGMPAVESKLMLHARPKMFVPMPCPRISSVARSLRTRAEELMMNVPLVAPSVESTLRPPTSDSVPMCSVPS